MKWADLCDEGLLKDALGCRWLWTRARGAEEDSRRERERENETNESCWSGRRWWIDYCCCRREFSVVKLTTPFHRNCRSPASCPPGLVAPVRSAPWSPVSPSSASCADSGTRSWFGARWDRGRGPFRCVSVWSGSGSCETPSPALASGSGCTSADHAVAGLLPQPNLSVQAERKGRDKNNVLSVFVSQGKKSR